MTRVKCFYSDTFVLPLPENHRFPMSKYRLLRENIVKQQIVAPEQLSIPEAATDEQLLTCHTPDYLKRVKHGQLTPQEIRRIGFPWSPQLVERSRRSTGATIAASHYALTEGVIGINLAGGTHHACRDHGEGYCVFNDAAVAARCMQKEGLIRRAVIIDCDVHQGNGTADILQFDETIFTFSIHGEKNFPFRKIASDLDIGLTDGACDDEYLHMVEEGTKRAIFAANADLAVYISGADAYAGDRLGKLSISKSGMMERDKLVLDICFSAGLPVAIAMGGGYADNVNDIVEIHSNTVQSAINRANA